MKISIIVPAYNVEKYIEKCLDSITVLDEKEMEIICVDDASTDSTSEILQKYAKKDSRVRVLSNHQNVGLSETRNRGTLEATGEVVWFIDGDDWLPSVELKKLYDLMIAKNLDVLAFCAENEYETDELRLGYGYYGGGELYSRQPEIISGIDFMGKAMMSGSFLSCVPFYLFKRKLLIDNQVYFENIEYEDNLFLPHVLMYAQRVSWINDKCYVYYRRSGSITTADNKLMNKVVSLMYVIERVIDLSKDCELDEEHYRIIEQYVEDICDVVITNYLRYLERFEQGEGAEFKSNKEKLWLSVLMQQRYPLIWKQVDATLLQKINQADSVIVYGNGNVSKSVQRLLYDVGVTDYLVAVTKKKNYNEIELHSLYNKYQDALLLVAADKHLQQEMFTYAKQMGFKQVEYVV